MTIALTGLAAVTLAACGQGGDKAPAEGGERAAGPAGAAPAPDRMDAPKPGL